MIIHPLHFLTEAITKVIQGDFSFISTEEFHLLKTNILYSMTANKTAAFEESIKRLENDHTKKKEWVDILEDIYVHYLIILLKIKANSKFLEFFIKISQSVKEIIPENCIPDLIELSENSYSGLEIAIDIAKSAIEYKGAKILDLKVSNMPKGLKLKDIEITDLKLKKDESLFITGNNIDNKYSFNLPYILSEVYFQNKDEEIITFQRPCNTESEFAFLEMSFAILKPGVIIQFNNYVFSIILISKSTIEFTSEIDGIISKIERGTYFDIGCAASCSILIENMKPSQFTIKKNNEEWSIQNNYPEDPMFVSLHDKETMEVNSKTFSIQGQLKMKINCYELQLNIRDFKEEQYKESESYE